MVNIYPLDCPKPIMLFDKNGKCRKSINSALKSIYPVLFCVISLKEGLVFHPMSPSPHANQIENVQEPSDLMEQQQKELHAEDYLIRADLRIDLRIEQLRIELRI